MPSSLSAILDTALNARNGSLRPSEGFCLVSTVFQTNGNLSQTLKTQAIPNKLPDVWLEGMCLDLRELDIVIEIL